MGKLLERFLPKHNKGIIRVLENTQYGIELAEIINQEKNGYTINTVTIMGITRSSDGVRS